MQVPYLCKVYIHLSVIWWQEFLVYAYPIFYLQGGYQQTSFDLYMV